MTKSKTRGAGSGAAGSKSSGAKSFDAKPLGAKATDKVIKDSKTGRAASSGRKKAEEALLPSKGDAYRVLARKYRPQRFEDLIGQEAMVRTLRNAFETGRIAQAYMLTGVRGVGKTTTARLLARALNYSRNSMPSKANSLTCVRTSKRRGISSLASLIAGRQEIRMKHENTWFKTKTAKKSISWDGGKLAGTDLHLRLS